MLVAVELGLGVFAELVAAASMKVDVQVIFAIGSPSGTADIVVVPAGNVILKWYQPQVAVVTTLMSPITTVVVPAAGCLVMIMYGKFAIANCPLMPSSPKTTGSTGYIPKDTIPEGSVTLLC